MKGKYWILLAAIALVGLGLGIYFSRRRMGGNTQLDANNDLTGCVEVPPGFQPWSSSFAGTDWGGYGRALDTYLDIDYDVQVQDRELVAGFFKAINVEPTAQYVRYFQDDLRTWLDANTSLPHWEVEQGFLRCN